MSKPAHQPDRGVKRKASGTSEAFQQGKTSSMSKKPASGTHVAKTRSTVVSAKAVLGNGWTKEVRTKPSGRKDKYYYSPAGKEFDSLTKKWTDLNFIAL